VLCFAYKNPHADDKGVEVVYIIEKDKKLMVTNRLPRQLKLDKIAL